MKPAVLFFVLLFVTGNLSAQSNYSLRFWGNADYVHVPDCPDARILGKLTIMFDIRLKDTTDWNQVISLGDDTSSFTQFNTLYSIKIAPSTANIIYMHEYCDEFLNVYQEEVNFESAVPFDQWTNVALVRETSAKKLHLYIDGALTETQQYYNQPAAGTSSELSLGHTLGATGDYMNALIDNLSIWYLSMTEADVELYSTCFPSGDDFGLMNYWNFNEGDDVIVNDITNGNNGILYGTNANWRTQHPAYNCTASMPELVEETITKEIVKIIDFMGREVTDEPNKILIYVYSDGSTQKIFRAE